MCAGAETEPPVPRQDFEPDGNVGCLVVTRFPAQTEVAANGSTVEFRDQLFAADTLSANAC